MTTRESGRCSSYDEGECTWGLCRLLGWLPEGLGNARDWLTHGAAMGLGVTGTPTVGSVMVGLGGAYDATFGHCALVEQVAPSWSFLVKEMNFAAWNHYDERWTTLSHVSGFLLPPGVRAGQTNAPGSTDRRGRNDLEASWSEFRNLAGVELPATHDRLRSVAANFRTLTP